MTRLLTALLGLSACIDASGQRGASDTTSTDTGASDVGDTTPPAEPCDAPGTTRCDEVGQAVQVCSDGAWRETACGDGRLCVELAGAQCLQASGAASCRHMVYCYLGCGFAGGPSADACALACYLEGTVQAQGQLQAFVGCIDRAACSSEPSAGDVLDCVLERCGTPLAQCYFPTSGAESCSAILGCREACGDDPCVEACGEDATLSAQGVYGVLELCLLHACATATTVLEQKTCFARETGVGGLCLPYVRQCLDLIDR